MERPGDDTAVDSSGSVDGHVINRMKEGERGLKAEKCELNALALNGSFRD